LYIYYKGFFHLQSCIGNVYFEKTVYNHKDKEAGLTKAPSADHPNIFLGETYYGKKQ